MSRNSYYDLYAELDLAGKVQQLLFPKNSPVCTWCCIGVKNRMVRELGGDYFDFITMPDHCQSLFLGDVTGHGLHASVVMSLIYGYIHRSSQGDCSPVDMAREVNRFLASFAERSRDLDHLFSSTLFLGIIHPQTLKMHYVNCGQVPPLVRHQGQVQPLFSSGPPLGFFSQPEIQLGKFQFQSGDRLLLYTDGLSEAKNPAGEAFGTARLVELLRDDDSDHQQFLNTLFTHIDRFTQQTDNDDDMTAIVIDFHSSSLSSASATSGS